MPVPNQKPRLPVKQLVILSLCRFADPVILTSVFPYLPEMIESFNVPKPEVAEWAGITSAVFSLCQGLTGISWGRAADTFGRKPAILVGLLLTMSAGLLFGFSQSLAWAMTARAIAGASSGNVGIIRTTVAELVPHKELQPRAFSVMPLVWSIGSIIGPMFGGSLAKPATQYPKLFGRSEFFKKFPFALPNMVASIFYLVGLVSGVFFLEETLEIKRKRKQGSEEGSDANDPVKKRESEAPPSYREVFSPQSSLNLLTYSLLALHSVAFDQLLPVFLHHPLDGGRPGDDSSNPFQFSKGFGLDSGRIGVLFTIYGILSMIFQILVFPPLARIFGVLNTLKVTSLVFPIAYLLAPFTVLLPTNTSRQIAVLCIMIMKSISVVSAFPCTTILLTNSAQSLRLLGTLNGVATSISAFGRAAGPALVGYLFTQGVEVGYVIVPFWVLSAFAAMGHVSTWWLIEMEGFGSSSDEDGDDSEDGDGDDGEQHRNSFNSDPSGESGNVNRRKSSTVGEERPLLASRPSVVGGGGGGGGGGARGGRGGGGEEEEDEENDQVPTEIDALLRTSNAIYKTTSHSTGRLSQQERPLRRTISNPIGIRQPIGPGGRRLSNGLGHTLSGLGTGGSSYH